MHVFLADSAGDNLHGFVAAQFAHADGVQAGVAGREQGGLPVA
jgi:hypothetical protein